MMKLSSLAVVAVVISLLTAVFFVDLSSSESDEPEEEALRKDSGKCYLIALCISPVHGDNHTVGIECYNEMDIKGRKYFLKAFSDTFSQKIESFESLKNEICDNVKAKEHFKFFSDLFNKNVTATDEGEKSDAEKQLSKFKACLQDYFDYCIHLYTEQEKTFQREGYI